VNGLIIQNILIRNLIMKNRYDGTQGKEAAIAMNRQKMHEAEHTSKNEFVKKVQAAQDKYAARPPVLKEEAMYFNAYQCNNGMHAQELASKITAGLDKVAFPVRQK
jgi:hypothetical protein